MREIYNKIILFWQSLNGFAKACLLVVLSALFFGLAHTQDPLYSSNQHLYFLWGMAQAHIGYLNQDWLAKAANPMPIFSWLVKITILYLRPWFFYCYQYLLFGLYVFCLIAISQEVFPLKNKNTGSFLFFIILTLISSKALTLIVGKILGPAFIWQGFFEGGLAGQTIMGTYLQASSFGVLFLLSILLWLKGKKNWAASLAILAGLIHFSYFFIGGWLILAIAFSDYRSSGKLWENIKYLLIFECILLLAFFWSVRPFLPTSLAISAAANNILVFFRFPQHGDPRQWLTLFAWLKIWLMAFGLYLIRRHRLFVPMLILFIVVCASTTLAYLLHNATLGALFPWRISTVIEPVLTVLVIGKFLQLIFNSPAWESLKKPALFLGLVLVFACCLFGALWMKSAPNLDVTVAQSQFTSYVQANLKSGQLYLIPSGFDSFRLYSGAPTFVEFKTNPYRDVEVLEWYKRLTLTQDFELASGPAKCSALKKISASYPITNIVTEANQPLLCPGATETYSNFSYRLYNYSF